MLIARTVAATTLSLGLVLAMGACSSSSSDTDPQPSSPTDTTSASDDETPEDETPDDEATEDETDLTDGATTTVKSSCEEFNTIMADLRLVDPAESDGYGDIADRAVAAQLSAPDETRFLFAPLYLIALDAGSGNDTEESMDILKDAVFAAAGDCTAQDVMLTM
ncbi:hypothetical protein SAMN05216410_0648 [Sanguibacter gelidistatuariae]|uniref:Lipoprotein n=1 Tax=Sanguibacter gelidistatuariae TaxID=1814289 RepID=A0A1G6H1I7_9MICO|nr:hypothetical protein [Sanguibacter gelidistatuariae]SDB88129.1 hypothetical protein SAMN05216410_0648 [Sanguibacter gelidistatuariae]